MDALREAQTSRNARNPQDLQLSEAAAAASQPAVPGCAERLFCADGSDTLIKVLLALGRRPRGGWHASVGITAQELDSYARSPEIRRLRMLLLDSAAVTPRMLHSLYRQKLFGCLLEARDTASINSLGKLVEKVPLDDEAAGTETAALDEQELRSMELLLNRLEQSQPILASRDEAAQAEQSTQGGGEQRA